MFVKKTKVVVWPKSELSNIYVDRPQDNFFSFPLNLWQKLSPTDLVPLLEFCQTSHLKEAEVLLPDDVAVIKSFIYDTQITSIEKKELAALAQSFVNFPIDVDTITYKLETKDNQTLIRAVLTDIRKIKVLEDNFAALGITITNYCLVSESIAKAMANFYVGDYFLIYSLSKSEQLLFLAHDAEVYLTAKLKGTSFDIQKIINYSPLYFGSITQKVFIPQEPVLDVNSTTKLELTNFSDNQINTKLGLPNDFPLPVSGSFLTPSPKVASAAIMNNNSGPKEAPHTMETKKNFLPVVIVFVVTVALASVIVYFIANRNSSMLTGSGETPTPTETIAEVQPTEELSAPTAVPTVAVDKKWKIQVQNATSINGQAGALKTKLTALGFTAVSTGNAADTATQNTIQLKPSLAGAASFFETSLSGYFDATIDTTTLTEDSAYDAVFVIGTKLGSDTTSTTPADATASPSAAAKKVPSATPTEEL